MAELGANYCGMVCRAKAADAPSIKVELLNDMAALMDGERKMTSEDVVKALGDMADRPWSDWKRGKPINQVQLARILKAFGIKSGTIWIGDKMPKGYYVADILAAQNRYAPATDPPVPLGEK